MTPRRKRFLFNSLRIVVCVGALWFVAQGVALNDQVHLRDGGAVLTGTVTLQEDHITVATAAGLHHTIAVKDIALDDLGELRIAYGLRTAWRNSIGVLFLLACVLNFPVAFFQACRLQCLLRAQEIRIGYWDCLKFSFAGNFLNFATPLGSNAGDVFKAYFVAAHTDRKTEGVTTIVLDRMIGLATLVGSVAVVTTLSPSERLADFRPWVLGALGVGVLVIVAYGSTTLRRRLKAPEWLKRMPMFSQLQRIDATACTLARHKVILLSAVVFTILLQGTAMVAYVTTAIALGLDIHLGNALECIAYFYTGAVIQALPGPPQGLGTVELAYRYFLAPFGSPSQIVCFALAVRLVVLVCALPGILVTITGAYKPVALQGRDEQAPNPSTHDIYAQ